jgi:DNA helicase HerA-like ATPase
VDAEDSIFVGLGGGQPQNLLLKRGNRHGLIAGATGTGKTVTLQGLAEGFSAHGVPVFMADVKGDLAGMAMAGSPTGPLHDIFTKRAGEIGLTDYSYADNPVVFWDLYGQQGHPIRTTVSEMGPTRPRKACSTSPSASPTSRGCCFSTSTISSRC